MTAVISEPMTVQQTTPNGAVSQMPATLECLDGPLQVRFEVMYPPGIPVVWTFPRALLDEGLSGPALREGCRAWPDSGWHLGLAMATGEGRAETFWLPMLVVQRFVDRALGAEWAELNGALS